ncbi:MAG: DUF6265 family protein [Planctomycetota bacterium]
MHSWITTTLAILAICGAASATLTTGARSTKADGLRALDGEWVYVEDRTEGRPIEEHQPSMSSKVVFRVEDDALVLMRRDGPIRIALDGSPTDVTRQGSIARYHGGWKDGAFTYEIELMRASDQSRTGLIRTVLRPTPEGLLARVSVAPPTALDSTALYRHAPDIALPAPAKAAIEDVAWLSGAWVGTKGAEGATSIEERWTQPLGGAMLAVSRTVSRGKMVAFEYLRIIEREAGLIYVAQPGGAPPTEFVLTELDGTRAVFENPRHDFPQRIEYELAAEGALAASIGYAKGGRPRRFDFKSE